jgi:uncharacterized protein
LRTLDGFAAVREDEEFVSENKVNAQTTVWRRHDIAGHEACRVVALADGWQIAGVAVLAYEGQACRLDYVIECDAHWVTRSVVVTGWVGDREIEVTVQRDGEGQWKRNGHVCDDVAGCMDIDLNFSPSTNVLPIRRCNLGVGRSAVVRAAWLRFPSFALEPLEQSYTWMEHGRYRYESGGGRFVAEVTVDATGMVIDYGDIWSREVTA